MQMYVYIYIYIIIISNQISFVSGIVQGMEHSNGCSLLGDPIGLFDFSFRNTRMDVHL